MKHAQILDKLAHRWMCKDVDAGLARLMGHYNGHNVEARLFRRWNCTLNASDPSEKTENYQDNIWVAIVTLMHKYGLNIDAYLPKAFAAIDRLNERVVLSDAFHRQTEDIKAFLQTPPPALKRKPGHRASTTYYRRGDVLSIQVEDFYFGAIIDKIHGINEAPIIRLYVPVYDRQPTLEEVLGSQPQGGRIGVFGLTYMPDLAGQVILLGACQEPPEVIPEPGSFLALNPNAFIVTDLFKMSEELLSYVAHQKDQA